MEEAVPDILRLLKEDQDFVVNPTRGLVRTPSINLGFGINPELKREPGGQARLNGAPEEIGSGTGQQGIFPRRATLVGTPAATAGRRLLLNGHNEEAGGFGRLRLRTSHGLGRRY